MANYETIWEDLVQQKDRILHQHCKEQKVTNWKSTYERYLNFGQVLFHQDGVYDIFEPLSGRAVTNLNGRIARTANEKYFLMNEVSTPCLYISPSKNINCELGDKFELGHIKLVDCLTRTILGKSVWYLMILYSSNVVETRSYENFTSEWKMDSTNDKFITCMNDKIKKISQTIFLTETGDVYRNHHRKMFSDISDIFSSLEIFGAITIKGDAFFINKTHFTDLEYEKKINHFEKETVIDMDVSDTRIVLLTESGCVYSTASHNKVEWKMITKAKGIRKVCVVGNSIRILKVDGKVYNEDGIPFDLGTSRNIAGMSGGLLLTADNTSRSLIHDIPDEILKCRYCQEDYQKDLNGPNSCSQMFPKSYHEFC